MPIEFREFLEQWEASVHNQFSQNQAGTHNDFATAKFLPSTWTGSEDLGPYSYGVPGVDLEIPTVKRSSTIRSVESNRNPIRVSLMDGTTLYLTVDEFRRVNSRTKLESGKEITVTFQRREDDSGTAPSKVISIE